MQGGGSKVKYILDQKYQVINNVPRLTDYWYRKLLQPYVTNMRKTNNSIEEEEIKNVNNNV